MVSITRRALLRCGIGALAATTAPLRWVNPLLALSASAATEPSALWLTRSTYLPLVNSSFSVRPAGGGAAALKLAAIRDLPGPKAAVPSQGCFSLLFDGADARFGQGAYSISHQVLGSSQLFLVPVGARAAGRQAYEVVVNRR